MISPDLAFDRTYFEDGVRSRVSAYENYRWMPERSIKEAISIARSIPHNSVLDYGCAKGFLVYALRLLGKEAFGVDISSYAIANCHPKVREFVTTTDRCEGQPSNFDLVIAKDVLEHVTPPELTTLLLRLRRMCEKIFIVVPLGENGRFRIREYELDVTHVIRQPEEWWLTKIAECGFRISSFDYSYAYIKEHWTGLHAYGNAFILAE
jgi:SAM-dependent methyltransferase